ncbi:HNH endonuclease [Blastococcus saxobsidens]|uniref:HNH endonuclease n=1 Tax=Blastococcus saxobsidens TaxID=138336 RepID=A0A6L9W332_9ACTN|nr:HNH endonuclease signature motif containing protein [Blastococcus saxobsidens]NEK86398.1 HNH endonuclease [Blastococcus saxobsidens]
MEEAPTRTVADGGAPAAGWASGPLGAVQAADREIARQTAVRARAVAEFAASRPASVDRQPGEPGAMSAARRAARPQVLVDVSEWATQELALALSLSTEAAQQLLERSSTLVRRLPGTLAALEAGTLHVGHLWTMLERVGCIGDDEVRLRMERDLVAWAAGRVTTPAQLAAKARRMGLARLDAERLLRALRERGVWARPDRRDGMAVLESLLTVPEAQAMVDVLGQYADQLDDPDDTRTRGQKMADVLLDLVLRRGEHALPPVQAHLTVVAGARTLAGGDVPGEIGGEPVPAKMVRALARGLGLLPEPAAPAEPPEPAAALPATVWDPGSSAPESWPEWLCEADRRWEAELEERALAGVWRGEDDPPPEVQLQWWNDEPPWIEESPQDNDDDRHAPRRVPVADDTGPAPGPPPDAGAEPAPTTRTADARPAAAARGSSWAAAHAAVQDAGLALLRLDRAVGSASAAVGRAWLADRQDEHDWRRGPAGRIDAAHSDLAALTAATDAQRAELAALLDRSAGGTLVDRPRIAVVDELTGALVALTDSRELRRHAHCGRPACARRPGVCDHDLAGRPGLGPPPPTDGYRPGAALDRFLRARDRRCRFPGCRRRVPRGGELDHSTPYPDGPTSAANLTGFCTGHHRGKHQAPGWTYDLEPDGTLTVSAPTGLVASTEPPPF